MQGNDHGGDRNANAFADVFKFISGIAVWSVVVWLAALACSAEPTTFPPTATAPNSTSTPPSAPVVRSQVAATFSEPLSSGLSVADVVENALPSVARIVTGGGTGTGFVINESGLLVTNKHVVEGYSSVSVEMATGSEYRGSVTETHPTLDLAYIKVNSTQTFTPIAVGDSDEVRVGAEVIAIGFPLGSALGDEPTVSRGIISAKRDGRLQTDASLNPGNSGGPLLDMFGQAVGVVVSRVVETDSGRPITGIGFAIPINEVRAERGAQVSPGGRATPRPTPTLMPASGTRPTPIPTSTPQSRRLLPDLPTATVTPTGEPTPTLIPVIYYCDEWRESVILWIAEGHNYFRGGASVPTHPEIEKRAEEDRKLAYVFCEIDFPHGRLHVGPVLVGYGEGKLIPGLYEYRVTEHFNELTGRTREATNLVEAESCHVALNHARSYTRTDVYLPVGEPFTFRFTEEHGEVVFFGHIFGCEGQLYRVGS